MSIEQMIEPLVLDRPKPIPLRMDGICFPPPSKLFDSKQSASDAMHAEIMDVFLDLKADGYEVPYPEFLKQSTILWNKVWLHYG